MDWDLKEELRDCLVAAAPYGGPIGMSPLCYRMLWDHEINSRSLIPGGFAVGLFLLAYATLSHPPTSTEMLLILILVRPASYGVGMVS